MHANRTNPKSAEELAWAIRSVARQSHRAISGVEGQDAARHVLRRIDRLKRDAQGRPPSELSRWLANLRRRVEDAYPDAAG